MDLYKKLMELDFISVGDLSDDEVQNMDMCVLNVVKYNGGLYILAAAADDDLSDEDDEEPEGLAEEAFVFKVCDADEAEFVIGDYDQDVIVSVTTDIPSEEFAKVGELLAESDEYDLEIESDYDD